MYSLFFESHFQCLLWLCTQGSLLEVLRGCQRLNPGWLCSWPAPSPLYRVLWPLPVLSQQNLFEVPINLYSPGTSCPGWGTSVIRLWAKSGNSWLVVLFQCSFLEVTSPLVFGRLAPGLCRQSLAQRLVPRT